jgi:PAS domain S-box-containing protein
MEAQHNRQGAGGGARAAGRFPSLRIHLFLLVSIAIIPMLGLAIYSGLEQRAIAADAAQENALQLARIAADQQDHLIDETHQLLAVLAQLPCVQRLSPGACSAHMAGLLAQYPIYASFGVIAPDGDLVCSTLPFSDPVNLSDHRYFHGALETRDFAIGDFQVGRVTGVRSINFGYPALDEAGAVQAVVFATLDLDWLNDLAAEAQLPDGSVLTVIDRHGTILARSLDPDQWVGQTLPDAPIIETVLSQGQGEIEEVGVDGVPRLYAFMPLDDSLRDGDAYVFVGIPEDVVYAGANRALARNLSLLGLVTVAALLAAWLGSEPIILRRVNKLVGATHRLRDGDLSARTGLPPGPGEIGLLSQSFDEMAESLERLTSRLKNLLAIDRAILTAASPEAIAQSALKYIPRVLPSQQVSIVLFDFEADECRVLAAESDSGDGPAPGTSHPLAAFSGDIDRLRGNKIDHGREASESRDAADCSISSTEGETRRVPSETEGPRSYFNVPLVAQGELIGALNVRADGPDALSHEPAEIAQEVAHQLAIAIRQAQLFAQTQRQTQDLSTLLEAARASSSTLDLDERLAVIAEQMTKASGVDGCTLSQWDPGADAAVIWLDVQWDGKIYDAPGTVYSSDDYPFIRAVFKERQPISLRASDGGDGRDYLQTIGAASLLMLPMAVGGQIIGAVELWNNEREQVFTPAEVRLCQALADQAAVAIENALLYQELAAYSGFLEMAVAGRTTELRSAKERAETILNNSPDAILLLKADGSIEAHNRAFCDLFGYGPDEVYGQPPTALAVPDHVEAWGDMLRSVIAQGETRRWQTIARRKDGLAFDASVGLAPIMEDGVLMGMVCSLRDISALKAVERMKDEFVSNVSHELRTPITSLKLLHHLLTQDPKKRRVNMDRMAREIDRLNLLIEDLLRLSRLDQGRVAFNLAPVDLNALAAQYVGDRTLMAESRELTLALEAQPGLPPATADEGLLGQVLSVLLTNAFNYTPAGGTVTVHTQERLSGGVRWVGFAVSDTGPGIPPDEQSQLFERFFRGTAGRTSGVPGTGLGLAIAREIVARHQGQIELISTGVPGEGASFAVWLPGEIES